MIKKALLFSACFTLLFLCNINTSSFNAEETTYEIQIPKTITIDSETKNTQYKITASGTIEKNYELVITPQTSEITLSQTNKNPVTAIVTTENNKFTSYDSPSDSGFYEYTGTISASELTAGNWSGELVFNIKYNHIAGLFDNNDNLLATWEELIDNYGFAPNATIGFYDSNLTTQLSYIIKNSFPVATKCYISNEMTSLPNGLFNYCSTLKEIIIPDSVTSAGGYIFNGCIALESIEFPDKITSFGFNFFYNCKNLTYVKLPKSLASFPAMMFGACTKLTGDGIIMPDNLLSIGNDAFNSCSSLTSFTIPDSVTTLSNRIFYVANIKEVTIPASVKSMSYESFSKSQIELIIFEDGLTEIPALGIAGTSQLTNIILNNTITTLGEGAFAGCTSLETIYIPKNVTSIGDYCFSGKTFTVSHITAIYEGCANLHTIYYEGTEDEWNSISFGENWDLDLPEGYQVIFNATR